MKFSRRQLIQGTMAASASVAVSRSGVANIVDHMSPTAPVGQSGLAPRQHLLFDRNWRFTFGNAADASKDLGFDGPGDFSKQGRFKFALADFDDSKWDSVTLPHDWSNGLKHIKDDHMKGHGYFPVGRKYPGNSIGWYRRTFLLPAGSEGKRILLEFDGIYHRSQVFINGSYLDSHESGYSPVTYDITDFLDYKGKNTITVRVDATHGDGWFYQGAGIYRHAWITITDPLFLAPFETIVRTEGIGSTSKIRLSTVADNNGLVTRNAYVHWEIFDPHNTLVARATTALAALPVNGQHMYEATTIISHPALWDTVTPNLYRVVTTLRTASHVLDRDSTVFGVRSVEFTADHGMLLNGKPLKLKGVCNHQDHACVGSALPDRLQIYRTELLLKMGCNALRTSHNYPTPELIDACDRLGMTVMCESRTFSSSRPGQDELANMVRRFRNHPSVVIWSLGNEEYIQGTDEGERIAARNQQLAHHLDPTRPCTVAMHLNWGKGISKVIDVQGFNYHMNDIDEYRRTHPKQPLIGTETSSQVGTRGIYTINPEKNWVSSYDTPFRKGLSHASSAEEWWQFYASRDYLAGGYAWTGFDYRGEPSPYSWPSTSSQFGIMDLCGFPKDNFFYYKAWWTNEPVLHLLPHWNWDNPDVPVDVWVYSNLDAVELFVNGKSLGAKPVPKLGHVEWLAVPFEPGVLEARGTKNGIAVLMERRETAGQPAVLRLTSDRSEIDADGEDVAILTLEVLDKYGRIVPTACPKIEFSASGEGKLLGLGNGDPNCLELDGELSHSTFNGLAQAILQSTRVAGTIQLVAKSPGLESATISILTRPAVPRPALD